MEERFTIAGIEVVQPDEMVGFDFETTYTKDSGRIQTGPAKNTPMFTVQAYGLKWNSLTLAQARQILNAGNLIRGHSVMIHYPDAVTGQWETRAFTIAKGSASWSCAAFGAELIEGLAFNIVGDEPI